jgi:hypothetical protein
MFSQEKDSEINYSSAGIFDHVFDKEGNVYKLTDISISKPYLMKNGTLTTTTLLFTSGIFEFYFESGSGMELTSNTSHNQRRAILCQAFQDISDFINTPLKNAGNNTKVKIWVISPTAVNLPTAVAGGVMAYYSLPTGILQSGPTTNPNLGGIIDNEIWKTIHAGIDSYTNVFFPGRGKKKTKEKANKQRA